MMQNQDDIKDAAWDHIYSRYIIGLQQEKKLKNQIRGDEPLDIFISRDLHKTMLSSVKRRTKMFNYLLKLIDLDR